MPRTNEQRNAWRKKWTKPDVVIGIDESYTRTGIAVAVNGKLQLVTAIAFPKANMTKSEKRRMVCETVDNLLEKALKKYDNKHIIVLVEKIRTYTQTTILSSGYIKSTAALIAAITDVCYFRGVQCWSVDTRAWKSGVLGSAKPDITPLEGCDNPQKFASIRNVIKLGFADSIKITNGRNKGTATFKRWDDDAADAANIALYGFLEAKDMQLSPED